MSLFSQRLLNIKPASESLSDKIKKQRKANEELKAKIAIRDKQIAQNKQKIESLEKEKEEKLKNKPSSAYLSLSKYIKGNK